MTYSSLPLENGRGGNSLPFVGIFASAAALVTLHFVFFRQNPSGSTEFDKSRVKFTILNFVTSLIHLFSAAGLLLVLPDGSYTQVTFQQDIWTVYANDTRTISSKFEIQPFRVDLVAVAAFASLVSGLMDYAPVVIWGFNYAKNPFRWIDYSISAPLLFMNICIVSGIRDTWAIVGFFLGMSTLMICAGTLERFPLLNDKPNWYAFAYLSAMYVALWLPSMIMAGYGSNPDDDGAEMPDWVWALIITNFLIYSSFAFIFVWYTMIKRNGNERSQTLAYLLASVTAKVYNHWFWVAVRRDDDTDNRFYFVLIVPVITVAIFFATKWYFRI